jgi:hypothetical protein
MRKPVFIEPDYNKDTGDCCVMCLKMWTGKGYKEVIDAAPPDAHKQGMWNREVIETAAKLGVVLTVMRKYDLYKDDGILMLRPNPKKWPGAREARPHHAVLLFNGVVLDPYNARVWPDVELYLLTEGYKPGWLLIEEGQ